MKDRPILFQGAMVRALLASTKTQTRRRMLDQPHDDAVVTVEAFNQTVVDRHGDEQPGPEVFGAWWADGECGARCPYGAPGDQLWVKETYFAFGRWETRFSTNKARDEWHFVDMTIECGHAYQYAVGSPSIPLRKRRDAGVTPGWWKRPAIFMPRTASRLLLNIGSVRVERLQAISEADALAEGIAYSERFSGYCIGEAQHYHSADPRESYFSLWEAINGPGSVQADPWVWAVQFNLARGAL